MSAKALLGVHKRHESLADEPSALDMKLLIKLYRGRYFVIMEILQCIVHDGLVIAHTCVAETILFVTL